MTSIFKMKQQHDCEKRVLYEKIRALYIKMGEPYKPEPIKKKVSLAPSRMKTNTSPSMKCYKR